MERSGKRNRGSAGDADLDDVVRELNTRFARINELRAESQVAEDMMEQTRRRAATMLVTRLNDAVAANDMDAVRSYLSTYLSMYEDDEFDYMNDVSDSDVELAGAQTLSELPANNVGLAQAVLETATQGPFLSRMRESMVMAAVCANNVNVARFVLDRMRLASATGYVRRTPYYLEAARCGAVDVLRFLDEDIVGFVDEEVVEYAADLANNPVIPYLLDRPNFDPAAFSRLLMQIRPGRLQPLQLVRRLVRLPEIDASSTQAGVDRAAGDEVTPIQNVVVNLNARNVDNPRDEDEQVAAHIDYLMAFLAILLEHPDLAVRTSAVEQWYPNFRARVERAYPGFYDSRRQRVRQSLVPASFSLQARERGQQPARQRYEAQQTLRSTYDGLCSDLNEGLVSTLELKELARILGVDVAAKTKRQLCEELRRQLEF